MPTPFPGMDPYLEHPALWPDVHNSLIVALRDALAPQVRPRYYVAVEERIHMVEPGDLVFGGRADVAVGALAAPPNDLNDAAMIESDGGVLIELAMPVQIRETYLEVRLVGSHEVVTVLEVLSPTNKRPGEGREQYLRKRNVILASMTHLVELDLLRAGEPMPFQRQRQMSDYRILISRAAQRPKAWLIPFGLKQVMPSFTIPLYPGDPEPSVDLNQLLHDLHMRSSYDLRVDYRYDAEPPLHGATAAWADALLREAGLR
ncbi:MAG: DUF4058 family protein [Oscillochloridaceae bacterium umkhey_bin13]